MILKDVQLDADLPVKSLPSKKWIESNLDPTQTNWGMDQIKPKYMPPPSNTEINAELAQK